ncbi:MAG: efflux RND transporter periplasmic adaptor subunit [Planctomycetes bacterium]|nr:efflux RND transporter periplasmic adaptor subunit [Planctomycetota bacterium]
MHRRAPDDAMGPAATVPAHRSLPMFPTYVYFLLALAVGAAVLGLAPFAGGRRLLLQALPAGAFFLLLGTAAEFAYHVGARHGGSGASGAGQTYTCSMHPQVRQDGPGLCPMCHMDLVPLAAAGADAGPGVRIDPLVVQNMGVRVHEVARGRLQRSIRAFAALRAAENRQVDVALKFDAFVERLHADTEGMRIEVGAPLFELYAPELIVAQEELIAAGRSGDPLLLAAARQKLRFWDVPAEEIDRLAGLEHAERTLGWRSATSGVLLQRNVVQGSPVRQGEVLLRVADLSVLWLDAQVAESDLAALAVGQEVEATLDAAPGRTLAGRIVFVAPRIDLRTRTGTVRVEVPNADGDLRPGMFARLAAMRVLAEDVVLAPAEAVLDTGLRQAAWVAVGKGRFEPRRVVLGRAGDFGLVEIRDGLEAGDRVVVSGQFLIDSESRLREGMAKLQDDGLMPGGDLPERRRLDLSAATQQQVDDLLAAYLEVCLAMAGDRHEPARWQALRAVATDLTAAPESDLQPLAAAFAAPLQRAAQPDLVTARVEFKLVSAAAERLFEVARPRAGQAGARLYVQHCPMAEADWLALEPEIRNPYYGSSMLACGEVRRELALATEAGK